MRPPKKINMKKPDVVITHLRVINITNNAKSLGNKKYIADPVRSKLTNWKGGMSNVVIGKDKNKIEKVEELSNRV